MNEISRAGRADVIHAHARALTLKTDTGSIFSLVTLSLGNGPFHVRLRTEADLRRLGKTAQIDWPQRLIRFPNGDVDFTHCREWKATLEWELARSFTLPQDVLLTQDWSRQKTALDPLDLDLFNALVLGSADRPGSSGGPDAAALSKGLQQRAVSLLQRGAHSIMGRGCGLTPAGDDFLLGVMMAIWLRWDDGDPEVVCKALLESVAQQTSRLSGAFLLAAARGAFREAWHAYFSPAITTQAEAESHLHGMLDYGHSSGLFSLAGCQRGLQALTS